MTTEKLWRVKLDIPDSHFVPIRTTFPDDDHTDAAGTFVEIMGDMSRHDTPVPVLVKEAGTKNVWRVIVRPIYEFTFEIDEDTPITTE